MKIAKVICSFTKFFCC